MEVPRLVVVGRATREVVPDRVLVRISVKTAVSPTPQAALSLCADARRRLVDDLAAACPTARVSDGRITTNEATRQVTTQGVGEAETRWETYGYTGHAVVTLEDAVAAAAGIVARAGTHADASTVLPGFVVGPDLERATGRDLEQEAVRDALERAVGLAAAAGMGVGAVIAIEEPSGHVEHPAHHEVAMYSRVVSDAVQEALGELRPEPVTRVTEMVVRVALVAAS